MPTTVAKAQTTKPIREIEVGRIHFNKILVTTDFSPKSHAALQVAATLAHQFHSKLYLVNAASPYIFGPDMPDFVNGAVNAARALMRDEVESCPELEGLLTEEIIEVGLPFEIIKDIVAVEKIDLIVCGSHGAHGIEKLVLGSMAEAMLRHANCPVLVIGPKFERKHHPWQKILVATELPITCFRAPLYAMALAEKLNAGLTLVHVAAPATNDRSANPVADCQMVSLYDLLAKNSDEERPIHTRIITGDAREKISAVAQCEHADVIVMGSLTNGVLADHNPWGILTNTIQHANCPVLVVPGRTGK